MNSEKKRVRADAPTVLLHWALVATLLLSLATGFRVAIDAPTFDWIQSLDALLPQGQVTYWHVVGAVVLSIIAVAYVVYINLAGFTSRIRVDRYRLRQIVEGNFSQKIAALNVLLFWFSFSMILLAAISGAMLYWDTLWLAPQFVRSTHELIAWLVLAYVALHIFLQLLQGGAQQLLKIMSPSAAYGSALLVALFVGSAAASTIVMIDKLTISDLRIEKLTSPISIDGKADDDMWKRIEPVAVNTSRGANESAEAAKVNVRAAHDEEYFYAVFEWRDSTRSQKHLPLIKTEQGWQVLQHEYAKQDEDDYYEDKFGVMFSTSSAIAASGTAHMGPQPLNGKPPSKGGRGLHYTNNDSIVDVWHWKSVRTGSTLMNQIDDNYFGPPMEPKENQDRYTGGYTQDPNSGGGFKMNWQKFSSDTIQPLRLPKDPATVAEFQKIDIRPNAHDNISLFLDMNDTVPYSAELDTYPVGTIIPSVLINGPFEGDRGDVQAVGQWSDGKWTLEIKRKLDTRSKFDVAIEKNRPLYMWLAVFDHSQTRHSQHLHPVRVVME